MIRIVVPYTKEVLDAIIYDYQEVFWPFQVFFVLLALWVLYAIWKGHYHASIVAILAFFWVWVGAVYEIQFYKTINWIGFYVGMLFILQGLLLIWFGMVKGSIVFVKSRLSLALLPLIILGYPLLQFLTGTHHYELAIVGMLPNITVAFTFIVLWTHKNITTLLIIPLVWSVFSLYWQYLLFFN